MPTQDDTAPMTAYTLRLDQDQALALDALVLDMRRRTGHRIDKSALFRALLRLTDANPVIAAALCEELRRTPD
ncbi:hypothetical protein ABT160_43615 [Streptomyces sp. NPDC001941]|uniref:hypothetical protein n=1 Tax=Streptomyces sp. NPDC001941 TaxID=3154659 RepID=UPI00333086F4